MAANGTAAHQDFASVIAALAAMQGSGDRVQKVQAHEYLEQFQKSERAWEMTFAMLLQPETAAEAKLFAATTLKGKIVYDLHQLSREFLHNLRVSLFKALRAFAQGPKPIRMQLCVCLANLAIQMTEWKDVLPLVLENLDPTCVLDFLRVLPEEITEGRKINLTEDELQTRTRELLQDNAQTVVGLLVNYCCSSDAASRSSQLMECVQSWTREAPLDAIINSPLLDTVLKGLSEDGPFESAVECTCAVIRETRDVDECMDVIEALYPKLMARVPRIELAADAVTEVFKGITRVYAEAGEAWVVLIARQPEHFQRLVESMLIAAKRDEERDVISLTFNFWYELKQYLTLDRYTAARAVFMTTFSELVDAMIRRLEYPKPESGDEKDLFEGDREEEEKFREYRHQMGDVLKDCCEVIGVTECLRKCYDLIENWVVACEPQAGRIPDWQKLEAPLFAMRAMGRMIPQDESIMLPRLMPLLLQIPDHERLRFQAVMVLGRYTMWTARNPATLPKQLEYIEAAFDHPSKEVVRAAALAFKFFCNDCAPLLGDCIAHLQQFYSGVLDRLPASSQDELTDGVASVLAGQPPRFLYSYLKLFCDPVLKAIVDSAHEARDDQGKLALADKLQIITIFIQWVQPDVPAAQPHPCVTYCQEIFPILASLCDTFPTFSPILERVCRCWRYMVLSYRTHMAPLLPDLALRLVGGFTSSRQGCFLWATDSVVREFAPGVDGVDPHTLEAVFQFYFQQATTFLRALSELAPEQLPDVIEDFFRLSVDVLIFFPEQSVASPLMPSILSAATTTLNLLKEEPLIASLHFLRNLLAYGTDNPPSPGWGDEHHAIPPGIRTAVVDLIAGQGEQLTQRIMTGMMYTFPRDCFADASGVLLEMFNLMPADVARWIRTTVSMLPSGSITPQEAERLMNNIEQRIRSNELQKIRTLLQDFTNSYRRRNVAPREGLGRLEATRFRFDG